MELRALKKQPVSAAQSGQTEQASRRPERERASAETLGGDARTFAERVHPDVLGQVRPELLTNDARDFNTECAAHPSFRNIYERIVLGKDRALLEQKTARQYEALLERYASSDIPGGEERLAAFNEYIGAMRPVRSERRKDIDVLKAPRLTGTTSSFGPQDAFVQADAYVYASLDGLRHAMAANGETYLVDTDVAERGELIMQDIANVGTAGMGNADRRYRDYLANLFDYAQGKRVLALYLASVFESPAEAEHFFQAFQGPRFAQTWAQIDGGYATDKVPAERLERIVSRMRTLMEETRIQPPMSLEVRVRDTAGIQPADV